MEHVAIDIGARESQICVRSSQGQILDERRYPTVELAGYLARRPSPSRVIVETCTEAFTVAEAALAVGHQVRVVPATLVGTLGVGARRTKTDQRDARTLSEVSCRIDLPSVHVPTAESRRRKSICGMRESLVAARTMLVNSVRAWLRARSLRIRSGTHSFGARIRALAVPLPDHVLRLLDSIDALATQIAAADRELEHLAKRDPVCARLMTVPGVGPVTAVRFVAALDDVGRFPDGHKVAAYLGLVPGERSSSESRHRLSITKAGSPALRRVLVQAAWSLRRSRRASVAPLQHWADQVALRRGKKIAIVALARKLVGILFAMWRDASVFQVRTEPRM